MKIASGKRKVENGKLWIFLTACVFFSASGWHLFSQSENPSENTKIPFTAEEAPRFFSLSSEDFPIIASPKLQALKIEKKTLSPEDLSEIRAYNDKIRAENEIWQQYQKDIERYNKIKSYPKKLLKNAEQPLSLFYRYEVKKDSENYLDTFNGLYARLQTKQGSLASINRISSPDILKPGTILILPIQQGMYIPKKAESALEILLQKELAGKISDGTKCYEIDGSEFYFIPDENFSPTIMAFFHDQGMQLPLSKKIVTSEFGYRTSPITGQWKFHAGIDLAAPEGTEVFACKSGSVRTVSFSEIYGNYIVILHNGKTTSLYAHLSKTLVKPGQTVKTGDVIGQVGSTGASTGPHLHFEVRENGTPTDPGKIIKN